MSEVFRAVPGAHEAFATASHAAGTAVTTAGSANHGAHAAAAAAAVGPIGAHYLAHFVPAQGYNLVGALQVGNVYHALSGATAAHKAATVAFESI